jgi:DNA mismatch endonuclease (patch repair protein)
VVPKTRSDWWVKKIQSNILNDKKVTKALKKNNWQIINVWECDLKRQKKTLPRILKKLKK